MPDLKFSVAMCVYGKDNPQWFDTAVDSVVNQTRKPDEIVLVVDGPVPDELAKIIKKYETIEFFKVIWLKENQGHGNARRCSLNNVSYDIVALMDADDICVPDRFEKQLEYFKDGNIDIVGGDIAEFIGDEKNIVAYRTLPVCDSDIKSEMKTRCPLNQMTVMFKKDVYTQAGGYIDWYCDEDYYLWLRMMQNGAQFANTGTVLVNVRVGEEMYRRRGGTRYFKSEAKLQMYMLKNKIINLPTFFINVSKRLIVQLLLPNRIRGWVFKKFARRNPK